jgi:hypothetical protein
MIRQSRNGRGVSTSLELQTRIAVIQALSSFSLQRSSLRKAPKSLRPTLEEITAFLAEEANPTAAKETDIRVAILPTTLVSELIATRAANHMTNSSRTSNTK